MKVVAYVMDAAGRPWDGLGVVVVAPGSPWIEVGKGKVSNGVLEAWAEGGAVLGLRIEGTGVLAAPVRGDAESVDLGSLVWAREPLVTMDLFCADAGRVHGLPKALAYALVAAAAPADTKAPAEAVAEAVPEAPAEPPADTSLGAVLARTGEDLATAQRSLASSGGFLLGAVQLTLRTADGAGGLKVGGLSGEAASEVKVTLVPAPTTRVVTASELAYPTMPAYPTLPADGGGKVPTATGTTTTGGPTPTTGATATPTTDSTTPTTGATTTTTTTTTTPPPTESPTVATPDVLGYSRTLAERKLAAVGLAADVSRIVTDGPAGVVVRQSPAPGTASVPGAPVRLYVNLGRS